MTKTGLTRMRGHGGRSARVRAGVPGILLLLAVMTGAGAAPADIQGSRDHPLVGRFAGSVIIGFSHKNFDEYLFPEGPMVKGGDGRYRYRESRTLEGEVTRILYLAPRQASVLEVFRNYRKQLERQGFEVVYSCKAAPGTYGCGYYMTQYMENFKPHLASYPYEMRENRYISMKKRDPGGDIHVSLLVYAYSMKNLGRHPGQPLVQLDVIRIEPLDDEQIVVLDADRMSGEIDKSGHVSLYGIHFDTDSARIKPASDPALEEIGKLLKNDPALSLYVVGHTDNRGTLKHNMALSRQRARAVVEALVSRYGVNPASLTAHGVGPLAPVATNGNEAGRAKNRRVDLVRQ